MSKVVVFLFHRDLRLEDNIPLQKALDFAKEYDCVVLPVFIFTPVQVGTKAPVKSAAAVACLINSLVELSETLKEKYKSELCILYDDTIKALEKLKKKYDIVGLFETSDVTPFAKKRQEEIEKFCNKNDIEYTTVDYLHLFPIGSILNGSGKTYQKFTPFYNAMTSGKFNFDVPKPQGWVKGDFTASTEVSKISDLNRDDIQGTKILSKTEWDSIKGRQQIGGRKEGLKLLKSIPKDYEKIRDDLTKQTSNLSFHHNFGTISIRESYYATGIEEFRRQLVWRDFYANIMNSWEELYPKYKDFQSWLSERPKLTKEKKKFWDAFCKGETGIQLVDAGIKQLLNSKFVHNRVRLVLASVLTKDYGIPWQYGAELFANHLLDYNLVQNTMNWLFVAEKFPFSQPPFRRHDPEVTGKRLDPKGIYIKTWLKN